MSDPAHKGMIDAVSQFGILMLLLVTGMETDLRLVRRVGVACFSISVTGVVLPFICGFALAQMLPDSLLPDPTQRIVAGLFLGTALSISSVKIVAMVVREMNFMRRGLGQLIVTTAIMEDTCGWVIIAITFGIASGGTTGGGLDWLNLAKFSDITITPDQVKSLYTNDLIDEVNKVDIKTALDAAKRA